MRRRLGSFGHYGKIYTPRVSFADVPDQKQALLMLADNTKKVWEGPNSYELLVAARAITEDCEARDDECELEAIFNAVKHGTDKVDWLNKGVRYVLDARSIDQFVGPAALMNMCKRGACAGDCDDVSALICALAGSLGFKVGLYAWGPTDAEDFEHVLAVAQIPKSNPSEVVAMDTTVEDAYIGWHPPPGKYLLVWLN